MQSLGIIPGLKPPYMSIARLEEAPKCLDATMIENFRAIQTLLSIWKVYFRLECVIVCDSKADQAIAINLFCGQRPHHQQN